MEPSPPLDPRSAAEIRTAATAAAACQDWPAALRHWETLRSGWPDRVDAHVGVAVALRGQGRMTDSMALLEAALARFGPERALLFEAARLAEAQGDRAEAIRRWETVRRHFPDAPPAHSALARLLRIDGRLAEAVAVLDDARARFPNDIGLMAEAARNAETQGDLPAAVDLFETLARLAPHAAWVHLTLLRLLRRSQRTDAADRHLSQMRARFPDHPGLACEAARIAAARGDLPDALRLYEAIRAEQPDHLPAYEEAVDLLRRDGQSDAAETLLRSSVERFPSHAGLWSRHADLLLAMHRIDEAEACYATIRRRFPDNRTGYTGGAKALLMRGERDAAEALLVEGLGRIPDDAPLALEHAMLPIRRMLHTHQQREEVLRRLEPLVRRFPDFAQGHEQLIHILGVLERQDDARQSARRAVARLPNAPLVAIAAAELALGHEDRPTALREIRAVAARFPRQPRAAVLLAEALSRGGEFEAAEQVLTQARQTMPASPEIEMAYGVVASRRGDWPLARERWAQARRRFPTSQLIESRLHDIRLHAIGAEGADDPDLTEPPTPERSADPSSLPALMRRFESLGGRPYGCEFGFVQRGLGADPLGLLRWTRTDPDTLAEALECRFAGIGTPEQTRLSIPKAANGEYLARDSRFGFVTHTFIQRNAVEPELMLRQVCMRQQFLSRRLLQHVADADRIFVYKNTRRVVSEDALDRLFRAFRTCGPATLLVVRRAATDAEAGTVERAAPGLLVGHLAQSNRPSAGWRSAPSLTEWAEICRQADQLARDGA